MAWNFGFEAMVSEPSGEVASSDWRVASRNPITRQVRTYDSKNPASERGFEGDLRIASNVYEQLHGGRRGLQLHTYIIDKYKQKYVRKLALPAPLPAADFEVSRTPASAGSIDGADQYWP